MYELNVSNTTLINMLKQLKMKWQTQAHLQNQIDALKHRQNKSEEKFTAEIAMLRNALKKSRDNHKIVMLKQIIYDNFITDLI